MLFSYIGKNGVFIYGRPLLEKNTITVMRLRITAFLQGHFLL